MTVGYMLRCHASNLDDDKEVAMLVLSRQPVEYIVIQLPSGELIRLSVQRVKGGQVRAGTEAPANAHILRSELAGRDG